MTAEALFAAAQEHLAKTAAIRLCPGGEGHDQYGSGVWLQVALAEHRQIAIDLVERSGVPRVEISNIDHGVPVATLDHAAVVIDCFLAGERPPTALYFVPEDGVYAEVLAYGDVLEVAYGGSPHEHVHPLLRTLRTIHLEPPERLQAFLATPDPFAHYAAGSPLP